MKLIDRILDGSSEKQVMERGKKIIDHAVAENGMIIEVLNGSGDIERFRVLEKLSDKEVFDISNSITSGAIAPNLIDDMLLFIAGEDDIVDTIFNLARALSRYRVRNRAVNRYVKENIAALSALIGKALVMVYEMHKAETLEQALKLREHIKDIEQEGDEIKDAMLDYAYKSKDIDFRSFYYVQNAAYLADDVLDGCEDTSDRIVSMMRSILT